MKIIDSIRSLLCDDLKISIHPRDELKGVESAIEIEHTPNSAIDPEDVIAWLVTQPNANGSLYLENVARQYMSALRAAPTKFQILGVFDVKSIFTCKTPDELNVYWDIFKSVKNYKEINSRSSGMFSAGMGCYMRYLKHLSGELDIERSDIADSTRPELCAHTRTLAVQACAHVEDVVPAAQPMPVINPKVIEDLTNVLSAHFANGYRLNSTIEMARFRLFASKYLGAEITLSDEELKRYISACGTNYNGKIYALSAETKEQIKGLAEEYFIDGAKAIFFEEFYAKNENWLFDARVVSVEMLASIFRDMFPKLLFTQTYFGYTNASVFAVLESEILRVWGEDLPLTYNQLAERLPYVPLERIKSVLSQNGDFIWSSVETFSHISRIEITDEERQAIHDAALKECNASGYVSIIDLPFGEIEERNHELSITAIHNAVYRICLSDKFDKKGKIVARKGDVFDALSIMKRYCRTIDKCSLADLLDYEKKLTGEIHRWIPMEAGNTILVRINKNTYVADKYVHFNAYKIDEAIGLFVKGDYLPLKSFTTFGPFPDCGQTWNLFLLESYCRRFSRKFRFDTPSVNSRNAGAVIRKSCDKDYTEIMSDAVANADVPLKDTDVGKYLYESGYTGRSTTAKVNEIIDKATAIREGRD